MKRYSTFETLAKSEEQYLKLVVEKISRLNPNIVVVSKSISGMAIDFLMQKNITCVRNVKPVLLRRLARFTGAKILMNHSMENSRDCLGTCENFYVNTYRTSSGKSSLMFFDGTPAKLGGTLLLKHTEEDEETLRKIKKVFKVKNIYNILTF